MSPQDLAGSTCKCRTVVDGCRADHCCFSGRFSLSVYSACSTFFCFLLLFSSECFRVVYRFGHVHLVDNDLDWIFEGSAEVRQSINQ